jgi:hypothetical protein
MPLEISDLPRSRYPGRTHLGFSVVKPRAIAHLKLKGEANIRLSRSDLESRSQSCFRARAHWQVHTGGLMIGGIRAARMRRGVSALAGRPTRRGQAESERLHVTCSPGNEIQGEIQSNWLPLLPIRKAVKRCRKSSLAARHILDFLLRHALGAGPFAVVGHLNALLLGSQLVVVPAECATCRRASQPSALTQPPAGPPTLTRTTPTTHSLSVVN